ncbi:MAG TPA: hypothetical protein VET88_13425 [Gammaproteobacteria bacterium]|nr:hypothetical protein [Gammaproteobacteria bacterium]
MTCSYNPAGARTSSHQMTLNGKRDDFSMVDFNDCARSASRQRGRAAPIAGEVQDVVSRWQDHAQAAGVPDAWGNGSGRRCVCCGIKGPLTGRESVIALAGRRQARPGCQRCFPHGVPRDCGNLAL